jgi:hypothetical protein
MSDKPKYGKTTLAAFLNRRLSDSVVVTLGVLGIFVDKHGFCYPSHKKIAKVRGIARATVQRHLEILRAEGLIEWQRATRHSKGGWGRNRYRILEPFAELPKVDEDERDDGGPLSPTRDEQIRASEPRSGNDDDASPRRGIAMPHSDEASAEIAMPHSGEPMPHLDEAHDASPRRGTNYPSSPNEEHPSGRAREIFQEGKANQASIAEFLSRPERKRQLAREEEARREMRVLTDPHFRRLEAEAVGDTVAMNALYDKHQRVLAVWIEAGPDVAREQFPEAFDDLMNGVPKP